jgi:hypothetical protein
MRSHGVVRSPSQRHSRRSRRCRIIPQRSFWIDGEIVYSTEQLRCLPFSCSQVVPNQDFSRCQSREKLLRPSENSSCLHSPRIYLYGTAGRVERTWKPSGRGNDGVSPSRNLPWTQLYSWVLGWEDSDFWDCAPQISTNVSAQRGML